MTTLSSNKPNEYPLTVSPEFMGMEPSKNGVPFFGGSTRKIDNLYADLAYSGNNHQINAYTQMNAGLNFDMGSLLRGLSADAYITFDNYNTHTQRHESIYPTYAVREYFDAGDDRRTT